MTLTADLRMFRHSGIGRYLRNLVPLLFPLLEADRIRVLAPREVLADAPWLADPRVELIETNAPVYSLREQLLPLKARFHPTHPSDLLWVPHYNAPLYPGSRMIVTIHDIAPLVMPQILSNPIKRAYAKLLIERAAANAAAILCVSEFTKSELSTRLHVPADKLTVTYPALDANWPTSAIPHTEPGNLPYLLYVGNIKPNKNLSLLLEAFSTVVGKLPHRLILAGKYDGFNTADAAVLHRAQSFGDRVRLTGHVTDDALQSLYAGASALVLPSLYEGFGLPLLEAMSLDCPILSSTAGSLPEVAGDAALYFNPHSVSELAARLLQTEDAHLMQNLRTAGHLRLQNFSYTRCAHQTATIMNTLAGPKP